MIATWFLVIAMRASVVIIPIDDSDGLHDAMTTCATRMAFILHEESPRAVYCFKRGWGA